MAEIRYSPLAQEDLRRIKDYIAVNLASTLAAKNTVGKITGRIRELKVLPEIGKPLSAVCKVNTDYRFLVCGSHLAFYRYEDETVYVVRVLYGPSNYLSVLFGSDLSDDPINLYGRE